MSADKEAALNNLCGNLINGGPYMMCRHLTCIAFPQQIEESTPEQALGELTERLLTIFFVSLSETFPIGNPCWKNPVQAAELNRYRNYFKSAVAMNLLFSRRRSQIPEISRVPHIIDQAKQLPEPPNWFPALLKVIHTLIVKLSEAYPVAEKITWSLFICMIQIYELMVLPDRKLPPRETIMMFLNAYTHQQLSRISAGRNRRLGWGKELDDYYQQELAHGLSKKLAVIIARERFRRAHPIVAPEDAEGIAPGLTSASLLKYHSEYLASRQQA